MTRRSLASVAALTSVVVFGLVPTAAYAGKPADKAVEKCEEVEGNPRGPVSTDCKY